MEALVTAHRANDNQRLSPPGTAVFANRLVQPRLELGLRPRPFEGENGSRASSPNRLAAKGDSTPIETKPISFEVDENVIAAFPDKGAELISAGKSGESLWGATACLQVRLPSGEIDNYFLKVVRLGETGRIMCHGEFESLKAIYRATPGFCPKPYAWGRYKMEEAYFLLVEFRYVGHQPADASQLGEALANMHKKSRSPTGKFGFHMRTCHARIAQAVDFWDDSWCAVFTSHLSHVVDLARPILEWPEFNAVADLVIKNVVPRLLLPLQEEGRTLKPCLVHGDCWDGNTAMDAQTGAPFIFDVCAFYAHNEYDIGNWRAPRHRLSREPYVSNYKDHFEVSPPEEEWDSRNLLYSLPYNIGNAIYVPGSDQRPVIFEDMKQLCSMFCAEELASALENQQGLRRDSQILTDKVRQQSRQESEAFPAEILERETQKILDEDEEEDEVEEEEMDTDVLENLKSRGIHMSSDTAINHPESEARCDLNTFTNKQETTPIAEQHELAITVEDAEGRTADDAGQIRLLEKVGTDSLGKHCGSERTPVTNKEDPGLADLETAEPMAEKLAAHQLQETNAIGSQRAAGDKPSASSNQQRLDLSDGLVKTTDRPNAKQKTKERKTSNEKLIEQAKNMQNEDFSDDGADWEDVKKDRGSQKAGAMRKRNQAVKKRKRRVLSSW